MREKYKLSALELYTLLSLLIILLLGYLLFYTNVRIFERYVEEDGTVEWLTVVGLMMGCIVAFSRFIRLFKKRSWWFLLVTLGLALVLFFGSGEEISWGQRIFGWKTPAYFEKHNAQHETNIHNLIEDGVKLNKLIFSTILSIFLAIYLLVIPLLHAKAKGVRDLLDKSAVPVPRLYQVISFVVLFAATQLLRHEKSPELLECGTGLLLFLIIRYPRNEYIFDPSNQRL